MNKLLVACIAGLLVCRCKPRPATPHAADATSQTPACAEPPPAAGVGSKATLMLQDGHTQDVQVVALSQDGRVLASGGFDGMVRIWNTATGLLLRRVPTAGPLSFLSLSDDGRMLASYVADGQSLRIEVRDLDKNAPAQSFTPANYVFRLSPDGKRLAVGLNGVWLHDTASGAKLGDVTLGSAMAQAVAFDPAGQRIAAATASANDSELVVLDVPTLAIRARFKNPAYGGTVDTPRQVELSGDALVLRTVVGAVHIIDLNRAAIARSLPGTFSEIAVAGTTLWGIDQATGAVGSWSFGTGAAQTPAVPVARRLAHLAASADGTTLALVANDPLEGPVIRIEDAASRRTLRSIEGLPAVLTAAAISPRSTQLVTGARIGVVSRWDARLGTLDGVTSALVPSEVVGLSYDNGGAQLAVAQHHRVLRVVEAASGRVMRQWPAADFVRFARFLPDGATLLTAALDGSVTRWDLSGPLPAPLEHAPAPGRTVAEPRGHAVGVAAWVVARADLAPDASLLALVGEKGTTVPSGRRVQAGGLAATVGVMSLPDGKILWETTIPGTDPHRRFVLVSPDGKSLLLSTAELLPNAAGIQVFVPTLRVYDARTGVLEETLKPDTIGPLAAIGDTLAIGGRKPVLIRWSTRHELQRLVLPDSDITAIATDPKRRIFAFSGDGGGTSIVSEKTASLAVVLAATSDGEFVATTADGGFVSSLDGARRVGWVFSEPLEAFSFEQFSARYRRADVVTARLAGDEQTRLPPLIRPPSVAVARHPAEVEDRRLSLVAQVSSARRVDRVRAFVNGRPTSDALVCAAAGEVKLDVPLQLGKNRVSVIAYDPDGFSSNARTLDVVSTARAAQPELWVASIGVSHYPRLPAKQQLQFADDDARAIAETLATQVGPGRPFGKLHETTLLDSEVTPASVERAIAGLARMRPDDLAVVFLAGHGTRVDGKMVFLTSAASGNDDNGHIGWDRIDRALDGAKGRVMLLLDACHSGHVSTEVVAANEALAAELARDDKSGVVIFAASRGAQLSYEVSTAAIGGASRGLELAWEGEPRQGSLVPAAGHGLFTAALLEALSGKAVDRDKSGALELGELIDFVTERVREASNGQQTPWVVRREMFGDFVIAPSAR